MFKKYILFSFVLAVSIFFVCLGVGAIIAPQIYFTDISINKENLQTGEDISGSVSLWNYEDYVISDLSLHMQLFTMNDDGTVGRIIDSEKGSEDFTLKKGEKLSKDFNYVLPLNLPRGELTLRVQLVSDRNERLGWIDKIINIENDSVFLILDNEWILRDGPPLEAECLSGGSLEGSEELTEGIPEEMQTGSGKYAVNMGVNYMPGEEPGGMFDVSNPYSADVNAYYKVVVYERNYGSEIVSEKESEKLTLKAKSRETVNITLPKIEKPGSYLAELKYYDEANNPISNSMLFRWVIVGDGAKILHVSPDKASYNKGERAKIQAEVVGPAGFCSALTGEEIFEVKLFNQDGDIIGSANTKIDVEKIAFSLDVPISKNVDNPRIEAKLTRNGEILDTYDSQLNAQLEPKPEGQLSQLYAWALVIIIIISIIVIIVASYFIFKSQRKTI